MGQKSDCCRIQYWSPPKSSKNNQRALVVLLAVLNYAFNVEGGNFIPADIELIPPEEG